MPRGGRFLPSPALVVACAALVVALGGTAYAQFKLPPDSVGSAEVRDRSLLRRDFASSALLQGRPGPRGPSGAAGIRWALVAKDGTILAQNGAMRLVSRPAAGEYLIAVGLSTRGRAVLVSSSLANGDAGGRGAVAAGPCGSARDSVACGAVSDPGHVLVRTFAPGDAALADHAFTLAVIGEPLD